MDEGGMWYWGGGMGGKGMDPMGWCMGRGGPLLRAPEWGMEWGGGPKEGCMKVA